MRTTERILDLDLAISQPPQTAHLDHALVWIRTRWTSLRNRLAANNLADLDDRLLNDVGLSRSDVAQVLKEAGLADDPSQQLTRLAKRRSEQALRGRKAE
ncbi:DUF1127 domain-containing protein [Rhizobium sp. AG855]|uniref:DUF1127 domain-containing protein n=1 Tax=Rhizobium sp. AG855 TaxID=2183898 RepID=UPI000E72AA79|nr:DUF1127 domain-containing protein [Rhizobium sp. AG855]RKE86025.1 uncharacterized protein DUF1127 [Rhizobium sp. AG855]HZG31151.1 DUF1127 domain-containing protein [Ensifer sp.]